VAGAWLISALFSLPILVLYEEKLIQGHPQCWIELGSPIAWQVYMSLVSATLFAIPALIISACYAIIVKTIWAKGSIFVPTGKISSILYPRVRYLLAIHIAKSEFPKIILFYLLIIF